jgi:hypothetical protein
LISLRYAPSSLPMLFCSFNQLTSLRYAPYKLTILTCDNNRLNSLLYVPPKLCIFKYSDNPISLEWQNLQCEEICPKIIQSGIKKINKLKVLHRRKIIYNCWVSHFDTPNDDNIAKHALLLWSSV